MKKRISTMAAIVAFAASPAFAATVVQTYAVNAANAPDSTTFSFAQFDSSLGTLDSVTLSFDADLSTTGTLNNTSNGSHTYTLMESGTAILTGAGFDLTAALKPANGSYTLGGDRKAGYRPAAIALTASGSDSDTLTSDLTAFVGAGDISLIFGRDTPSLAFTPSAGSLSNLATSLWGDATLTYNYTAAAPLTPPSDPVTGVPEPAVWSMLILGFAGIGAALRHRRRHGVAAVDA